MIELFNYKIISGKVFQLNCLSKLPTSKSEHFNSRIASVKRFCVMFSAIYKQI